MFAATRPNWKSRSLIRSHWRTGSGPEPACNTRRRNLRVGFQSTTEISDRRSGSVQNRLSVLCAKIGVVAVGTDNPDF